MVDFDVRNPRIFCGILPLLGLVQQNIKARKIPIPADNCPDLLAVEAG